jgi:RimJ/RimL family protein N-acetyltransferase
MLIRERASGAWVGLVENTALPGGVAVFVIYLDSVRGRPGFGLEATALYVDHLFNQGARLVAMEVLGFNTRVQRILAGSGLEPQARLREHIYAGGRFWDLLVYSIDTATWGRMLEKHRTRLPGGPRKAVALGVRRSDRSA